MYDAYSAYDRREQDNENGDNDNTIVGRYGLWDDVIPGGLDVARTAATLAKMEHEIVTLRNTCQVHIMEKDELRIQRSEALGKFFALARALMNEELEAGNVPQALARDLNLTTFNRAA